MYKIYLDKWGRHWIKLSEQLMWNSDAGWGGWFDVNDRPQVIDKNGKIKP